MSTLPAWFVVVMGVGTVFAGLICIVLICAVMGWIFSLTNKKKNGAAPVAENTPLPKEEQNSVIAAVSAAIAEELGTAPEGIRIVSIRKI